MKKIYSALIFGFLIILPACNNSSSNNKVEDIQIVPEDISVSERATIRVFFNTKRDLDLDEDPNGVEVVVRVPKEAAYVDGSSFLFNGELSDTSVRDPNRIVECIDVIYVVYRFDGDELKGTEFDDRFGFKFDVIGEVPSVVSIQASASDNQEFACGTSFEDEKSEVLIIS